LRAKKEGEKEGKIDIVKHPRLWKGKGAEGSAFSLASHQLVLSADTGKVVWNHLVNIYATLLLQIARRVRVLFGILDSHFVFGARGWMRSRCGHHGS
jgi:hypothetical protein